MFSKRNTFFALLLVSSLSTLALWLSFKQKPHPLETPSAEPFFSETFPAHPRFSREVSSLLSRQNLSYSNERLIHSSVIKASQYLDIPAGLLWCLLFQESRLNHLAGINESFVSTGLGQFSFSAFYEINHQLDRYIKSPKQTLVALLGKDVRPIIADSENPDAPHSYYSIPTGVTASALYLNNRKIQLERILQQKHIPYSKDILWVWAALSYNKGTRTTLSLWNQIQKAYGLEGLQKRLNQPGLLVQTLSDKGLLFSALKGIWQEHQISPFTEELWRHSQSIKECSFNPSLLDKQWEERK